MALLEEVNVCALCQRPVRGYVEGVPVYFCPRCFGDNRDAIIFRAAWAVFLLNDEKARRKRRNRLLSGPGLPTFTNSYQGAVL
ncbi:MAG TPA: hypothetical protein PKC19_13445 [Roseiflexaceae bacterium]|nr:hypothetical protein [Roseiflexaceae bacterium]